MSTVKKHPIETIKLKDIRFDPNNPNEMADQRFESLEYSLDKWGYIDPIVIDSNNLVANGEHRVKALLNKGVEEIEVIRYDFKNDEERKLFRQTMNKLHGEHSLKKDISELELLYGYNPNELKSLLGFDETGLDLLRQQLVEQEEQAQKLFRGQQKEETEADLDKLPVPEEITEPTTKTGDIWKLGNHYILCGDATSLTNKKTLLKDCRIDIILTDPPYSSGGFQESGKTSGSIGTRQNITMRTDNLSTRGYNALIKSVLEGLQTDILYLFTDWKMWSWSCETIETMGLRIRNMIVWDKMHMGMGFPWRNQHELIVFAKMTPAKMLDGKTGNIIQCKRSGNKNHPTEKPVEVLKKLLDNTEGKIVYDPFLGSGPILIACEQTDSMCYAMEIDPRYIDISIMRWENYTGQKAELIKQG